MKEGEVVVGFAVAAGGDPAFGFQPGVGALDRPAMAGLPIARFGPSFLATPDLVSGLAGGDRFVRTAALADSRFDLALAQRLRERLGVVAAVCPQFGGPQRALEQRVDQRQQVSLLVFVAGGEPHLEREAVGVYGQVIAASWPAQERARDLLAPFFASTSDASTITRDQSSLLLPTSRCCSTTIASASNPRRDHSSKRRRQVSPLGNPSSRYGTSSQGVSVHNTYRIPSRQARAGYRHRPGERKRRGGSGSNGANCSHNSSETRHLSGFTRPTRRRRGPA